MRTRTEAMEDVERYVVLHGGSGFSCEQGNISGASTISTQRDKERRGIESKLQRSGVWSFHKRG